MHFILEQALRNPWGIGASKASYYRLGWVELVGFAGQTAGGHTIPISCQLFPTWCLDQTTEMIGIRRIQSQRALSLRRLLQCHTHSARNFCAKNSIEGEAALPKLGKMVGLMTQPNMCRGSSVWAFMSKMHTCCTVAEHIFSYQVESPHSLSIKAFRRCEYFLHLLYVKGQIICFFS